METNNIEVRNSLRESHLTEDMSGEDYFREYSRKNTRKLMFGKEKEEMKEGRIKLSPSRARIFNMVKEVLIASYALIQYNASSLSSAQRKLVSARIQYLIDNGKITEEEVNDAIKLLENVDSGKK